MLWVQSHIPVWFYECVEPVVMHVMAERAKIVEL